MNLNDLPPALSAREAATLLRVSPSTIYRWVQNGHLPALRIGQRTVIRAADLQALLAPSQPAA